MGDRIKPQQGDEAQLFEQFNDQLVRRVTRAVNTSPEVVEDACARAWMQFLTHQPDREREWKNWLFRTAQHEAWTLNRQRYETKSIDPPSADAQFKYTIEEPADPRDPHGERMALDAAIDVLAQLPPRLRRIAFLRAVGIRYRDIGEITGDSPTRVNQLVAQANYRIHDVLERTRDDARELPARALRLRELEDSPPSWLTSELGRPPRAHNRRVASAGRLLAWRRAALAIDDYRTMTGFDARDHGLGKRPAEPTAARAFDLARRAIDGFHRGLALGREVG